jgi:hypothetical protein
MRRDFELYGSTLFLDRLGRPLNNKGWPLMTMAMLSGGKRVCIPCEAIVLSERVESYVWMIRAAVDMTPGFELSNLKVIFGDGILAGGTLLHQLGITQSCHIVLDHHHLLSGAIGAWPKKFGLVAWKTLLKDDCTGLVKTFEEETYYAHLNSIRAKVQHAIQR